MTTAMELTERERGWLAHLQRARESGLTLKAYAQANGLSLNSFYDAKSRLTRAGAWNDPTATPSRRAPAFVPVRIKAEPVASAVCRLTHASGWVLECSQLPPVQWLMALTQREDSDAQARSRH